MRRVVNAQGREIRSVEQLFEQPEAESVREAWGRFFEEVRGLAAEVRKDGVALAVLVFPFRFQVQSGAPAPIAQERIAAFCESDGLRCLDLLPALRAVGEGAFLDYDHLSTAGTRATAEALVASDLLPSKPSYPRRIGSPARSALEPLIRQLREDASAAVRAEAATALGELGRDLNRPAVPALFDALADPSETVRWRAAQALSRSGLAAPGDVAALVERLESPDDYVRAFAAWTLGDFGPAASEAVPALVAALQKEDTFHRGGAALALAKMGAVAKDAVPALVASLKSADHQNRRNAAKALGRIGPDARGAVPDLVIALEDDDQRVRAQVARALGRIGADAPEATGALEAATQDADAAVRREAEDALRRIRKGE